MRRPLRKPHGLRNEDIENFESTAKYVIYLDGTNYVAINGDTGAEDSRSTSAHTVIQYAIDNGGVGTVTVKCNVVLTAIITGARGITLDFTDHTITPASSFDMVFMKQNFRFRRAVIDVSGVAFTHVVFFFDGADLYTPIVYGSPHRTVIEDVIGISAAQRGKFVYMQSEGANEAVGYCFVHRCMTYRFEYAYFLDVTADNVSCWCNNNTFENIHGWGDKYFIFMTANAAGRPAANDFLNISYQMEDETTMPITIDGLRNKFTGDIRDLTVGETGVTFEDTADRNYLEMGITSPAYISEGASIHNLVILRETPSIQIGNSISFFAGTSVNPVIKVFGDDGGAQKNGTIGVTATGAFSISAPAAELLSINADGGISLNSASQGDVKAFQYAATGENNYVYVYGRDNADANTRYMRTRWGGTANDEGEIETQAGDLFLNPAGVVKFGTKTGTGDAVLDGYVTIKDAAGNTIKLATTA